MRHQQVDVETISQCGVAEIEVMLDSSILKTL